MTTAPETAVTMLNRGPWDCWPRTVNSRTVETSSRAAEITRAWVNVWSTPFGVPGWQGGETPDGSPGGA